MRDDTLIVTSAGDESVDPVVEALEESGRRVHVLLSDHLPSQVEISIGVSNSGQLAGSVRGPDELQFSTQTIGAVWWRKPARYFAIDEALPEQDREFIRAETSQALAGVWGALESNDALWVNHPARNREAEWKLPQLDRARRLGFKVPRTVVTTNPDTARRFIDAVPGSVIFKVLTDTYLGAAHMAHKHPDAAPVAERQTLTTRVIPEMYESFELIRDCPSLFQEEIVKQYEYRVTIVGTQLFVARIDSQSASSTEVDLRGFEADGAFNAYDPFVLPEPVAARCLELARSYGLEYCAIDLASTADGEWVFFEVNPNGQFLWVEHMVPELRMSEAIARHLAACTATGK